MLLADLLEISRYDANVAVLDPEPASLVKIAQQVVDVTRPLAEDAGSEVAIVDVSSDPVADVDSRRIERIVRNFVVNAIEHGEGRPIEIHVGDSEDAIAVAVRDFGIGMAPEQAERVFDRFWRADPARARKTGGSGLGLSIAAEDARLHGGWLAAWGSPGEGSAFLLVLPREAGKTVEISPISLPPGSDRITSQPITARAVEPPAELQRGESEQERSTR